MFRRAVFNVLPGNGDDHAKNHGFLRRPTARIASQIQSGLCWSEWIDDFHEREIRHIPGNYRQPVGLGGCGDQAIDQRGIKTCILRLCGVSRPLPGHYFIHRQNPVSDPITAGSGLPLRSSESTLVSRRYFTNARGPVLDRGGAILQIPQVPAWLPCVPIKFVDAVFWDAAG